jgi:uncharacterized UPF0146 family protein
MKTIYDFEIFLEKDVEREVEKPRQKKNKETGDVEKWTEKTKEIVKESVPCQILIKKPTRSLYEEADLFYSIRFSKYVKLGLLTDSQIAKKQIDVGDGFTTEQFDHYVKLKQAQTEKQALYYSIITKKDEISDEEAERKDRLLSDLSVIETELEKYSRLRISAYDHTADSRARNDSLMWWCLNLSYIIEGDDTTKEPVPMFEGQDFDTKKMKMEQLEDNEDPIYQKSYKKISDIVSVFYLMGISDKSDIEKTLEELNAHYEAEKVA